MPVKAKYIKDLPLKRVLDGSESLLVQDLNGTQQAPLEVIVDEIKQNSQEKIREIESELNQTNAQLSTKASKQSLAVERARIDNLTKLEEGSTTGDAELIDIRVGADGVNYATAGDAIRGQFKKVENGSGIENKALDIQQMSFFEIEYNLFQKGLVGEESGKQFDERGELIASQNYAVTGYIPVKGGRGYWQCNKYTGAFYNKNKQLIGAKAFSEDRYVIMPQDCAYYRFTVVANFIEVYLSNVDKHLPSATERVSVSNESLVKEIKELSKNEDLINSVESMENEIFEIIDGYVTLDTQNGLDLTEGYYAGIDRTNGAVTSIRQEYYDYYSIDVIPSEKYKISAYATYSDSDYCRVSIVFADSSNLYLSDTENNYSFFLNSTNKNGEYINDYVVTVPIGASKLYVTSKKTTPSVISKKVSTKKSKIGDVDTLEEKNIVDSLKSSKDKIKSLDEKFPISLEQTNFFSVGNGVVNLYNKDTVTFNKAVDSNGEEYTLNGYLLSDYMNVSRFSKLYQNTDSIGAFYDKDKKFVSAKLWEIREFEVPLNAVYYRTTFRSDEYNDKPYVSNVDYYVDYTEVLDFEITDARLLDYLIGLIKEHSASSTSTNKNFSGLKMAVIGDSWSDANNNYCTKRWYDWISEKTGITVQCYAKSGAGYKRREDENIAFYQQARWLEPDTDLVCIFGSGNDCNESVNYDFGTEKDTTNSTIGGCMNLTLDTIQTNCPRARIIMFSSAPWINFDPYWSDGKRMGQHTDLMEKVAKARCVRFKDMFRSSDMHAQNETFKAIFYNSDGVHPNDEGQKRMYPDMLAEVLAVLPEN